MTLSIKQITKALIRLMHRLVCVFVVRKPPKTGFLATRPIYLCVFSNFACFVVVFRLFTFSKNSYRNTIRVTYSLDPDEAERFVCSDLVLTLYLTFGIKSDNRINKTGKAWQTSTVKSGPCSNRGPFPSLDAKNANF